MKELRLIADDRTGPDTAAQFVTAARPILVFAGGRLPPLLPASFAIDAETRELAAGAAAEMSSRFAVLLQADDGVIAFKKVDSLLREPGP